MEGGEVALQRAVGLDGDKAPLGAQPLPLGLNDLGVGGIDLRDKHGDVQGAAVGGVIGHHRALVPGVVFLQRFDLVLFHVHGGEHEVHLGGDGVHIRRGVQHLHLPDARGDGGGHGPAALYRLGVGPARRAGGGSQGGDGKPGVPLQQGDKALAHHAGGADDADSKFLHSKNSFVL